MIKLGDLILPIATTGKEAIAQIDMITTYYDRKIKECSTPQFRVLSFSDAAMSVLVKEIEKTLNNNIGPDEEVVAISHSSGPEKYYHEYSALVTIRKIT